MADRDVEGLLRWGIASMSLASAVIHASVVPDHQGLPLHVAFFLVVAAVQSGLAALVLRRRSGPWVALTAACNGAVAVVWALSRTTGLPVEGASAAEAIGFKDAISTLFEIGVVAGAGLLAVLPEAGRRISLTMGPMASTVLGAGIWGLGMAGLVAHHTHGGHVHVGGGDVRAIVHDHRTTAGASHGDHEPETDEVHTGDHGHDSSHADHADHADAFVITTAARVRGHRHDHDATAEAATDDEPSPHHAAHHGHQPDAAFADNEDGGHKHEPGPDHDAGPGKGHDPGDDVRRPVSHLIDDVMGLLHTTALEVPT
jgi:hypothetical protein